MLVRLDHLFQAFRNRVKINKNMKPRQSISVPTMPKGHQDERCQSALGFWCVCGNRDNQGKTCLSRLQKAFNIPGLVSSCWQVNIATTEDFHPKWCEKDSRFLWSMDGSQANPGWTNEWDQEQNPRAIVSRPNLAGLQLLSRSKVHPMPHQWYHDTVDTGNAAWLRIIINRFLCQRSFRNVCRAADFPCNGNYCHSLLKRIHTRSVHELGGKQRHGQIFVHTHFRSPEILRQFVLYKARCSWFVADKKIQ